MVKITGVAILLIAASLQSCHSDAEKAAREFCTCLRQSELKGDHQAGDRYCDSILKTKYPLHRFYRSHAWCPRYPTANAAIRAAADKFEQEFTDYCILNCCMQVGGCGCFNDTAYISRSKILRDYLH